jgi:hypothetical protein
MNPDAGTHDENEPAGYQVTPTDAHELIGTKPNQAPAHPENAGE